MESHGGSALNITDLVATSGRVAVNIEELGDVLAVLWEERVRSVGLPLLIVVHHVVSLGSEKASQLLVGEESIQNENFIDSGLSTLVSDAGSSQADSGEEVDLPKRSVREHHEAKSTVGDQSLGPGVISAVKTREDLVKVITCAHSPLPVVRADHVGHILELGWVPLSLSLIILKDMQVIRNELCL